MIKIDDKVYEIDKGDVKSLFIERDADSHKGMFGKVGIIGGSINYSGAVKLANLSLSALRGGVGISKVIVPDNVANSIMPYLLEQILIPVKCSDDGMMWDDIKDKISDLDSIVIGMGLEESANNQDVIIKLLSNYSGTIVMDAGALNMLSKMDKDILKKRSGNTVLTPHLKEFSRLTGYSVDVIKKDIINISKEFAKEYGIILLLKGSKTIVTDGDYVYISEYGCSGMATAGSGDVLSGILGGMLGYLECNTLTVVGGAVLNGIAGSIAMNDNSDISQVASDTVRCIGDAIKEIRNS